MNGTELLSAQRWTKEVLVEGNQPYLWSPNWWPDDLGPFPQAKSVVKNLGVWMDADLTMEVTIKKLVS